MNARDIKVGDKMLYSYVADGLMHQQEVWVLAVKGELVKIQRVVGKAAWVKANKLVEPTN